MSNFNLVPPPMTGTEWARSELDKIHHCHQNEEGNNQMVGTNSAWMQNTERYGRKNANPYVDQCKNNTMVTTSAMDNCVTATTAMQANQVFVVQKPVAVPT